MIKTKKFACAGGYVLRRAKALQTIPQLGAEYYGKVCYKIKLKKGGLIIYGSARWVFGFHYDR